MNFQMKFAVNAALAAAFLSFSVPSSHAAQTAKACEEQWKSNKKSIQASGRKKKDFIAECRGANPMATAPAAPAPARSGATTPAQACEEQWKANKPSIQASGKTKKVFIGECRGTNPVATAPAAPAPARSSSTTPAKACEEQWKANKPSIQASGKTKKVFIGECRATASGAAAPAKPSATAAPAREPTPSAKTTTAPSRPATAGTPAGANQYATESSARLRCPLDTVVWVNLNSGIYHFNGKNDYGTTKRGAYMCEKDTGAGGFRAAKNEKHP